ncbi:hypothetical protein [Dyadobacter sp. OTU695]|uniref:hypothetical protein n=1 Tax=Dyadobacter sp. OTU695 TaxID=3043860 RepID=UPI00313F1242
MRTVIYTIVIYLVPLFVFSQAKLVFDRPSPFETREELRDFKIIIPFAITTKQDNVEVSVIVDDADNDSEKGKDYLIDEGTKIKLSVDNKYKGELSMTIKADNFNSEPTEAVHLTLSYEEDGKKAEVKYLVMIKNILDGGVDEPIYTEREKSIIRNLSIELFTGGNLDFLEKPKFKNIGGEFVVMANDIVGPDDRFGGFVGISTFRNFSYDSSNIVTRKQYIKLDDKPYKEGETEYIRKVYVDHKKISSTQWSYYFNPTFRVFKRKSDFFNMYYSIRVEVLRKTTVVGFDSELVSSDTSKASLGPSPVFQTGNGFVAQNVSDTRTNGFFSAGVPMILNANKKFKLYFDPNIGLAENNYTEFVQSIDKQTNRRTIVPTRIKDTKFFYLVRLRVSERFTGLNVTIGGEVRGFLPAYEPSINAYLGLRVGLDKLIGQ